MTGTILENLSNKKLSVVISIIFVIQIISFFIGAFIAPSPSSTEQATAIKCVAANPNELSIPRYKLTKDNQFIGNNCEKHDNYHGDITFAFQLPLPRDGINLDYSRWMFNLLGLLIPDVEYSDRFIDEKHQILSEHYKLNVTMMVILAVKDYGDSHWKEYARKDNLKRTINCKIEKENRRHGYKYDCDVIQLFELQSLFHDYYLINIRFNSKDDAPQYATLNDLNLVAIRQNGGFTKIWLSLKTIFTTLTLLTLLWYSKRLKQLHRETTILEKTLIVLGCGLTQMNVPIEFLSLLMDIEFMTFLCDLRQGIFHCALLSFWVIFTGEHLLDGVHRSRISSYYKQLSVVLITYIALFIFDLTERGIQWIDPFFTIWEVDNRFALIFILTASISSIGYFMFLTYHIWLAFRNISSKQSSLPSMSSTRRLIYQGIIYRFKFLLLATVICAAATVVAYILGQVSDDQWYFEDAYPDETYIPPLQWSSAMFTTVYALWNCYVITLLILYAPSHKGIGSNVDAMSEEIEFNRLTDEKSRDTGDADAAAGTSNAEDASGMSLLQQLANKQNVD